MAWDLAWLCLWMLLSRLNRFREIDTSKGLGRATTKALSVDLKRIKGTAKSFAAFGGMFAMFECMLEKKRQRHDSYNSFFSGAFTTVFLAMDSGLGPRGLMMTGLTGGAFGLVMEKLFENIT